MKKLRIKKAGELTGEVTVSGSKNAALPILCACLLTEEECEISGVPRISDVEMMLDIIASIGAEIDRDEQKGIVRIRAANILHSLPRSDLAMKMRASFLVMGPLLSRKKNAKAALPGGCSIGERPIHMHIKGFCELGARSIEKIAPNDSYVYVQAKKLRGKKLYLDYPSVGTTENLLMAAVLAEGVTILENVAKEPEIVDLAIFLNKMGAKISGAGTDTIKITGVERLHGASHTIIPDRIEAATYIVCGAITRSNIRVRNVIIDHILPLISKLEDSGVGFAIGDGDENASIDVLAKDRELFHVDIKTLPYPGFPTDMQSLLTAYLATCAGESEIIETVFENRFMHVDELKKLGARIEISGQTAKARGDDKLAGAKVRATDLRSGAALIVAALAADGETVITDVHHIDRGYENYVEKLKALGAEVSEE